MHWIDSFDIRKLVEDTFYGAKNISHRVTKVFAAMRRYEDQSVVTQPFKDRV